MPMGKAAVRGAPRSVRGGRSDRYEARREARGTQRSWAPSWSDATASAVMQMLEDASEMATGSKELKRQKVTDVLASAEGTRLLVSCAGSVLVPADKALVATIVQHHHKLVHGGQVLCCWRPCSSAEEGEPGVPEAAVCPEEGGRARAEMHQALAGAAGADRAGQLP